jgi:hypothetical protein
MFSIASKSAFRLSTAAMLCAGIGIGLQGCAPDTSEAAASDAVEADGDAGWVAEQSATATTRLEASDGGRIVLRAINAAGGLDAWYGTATSSYGWEYSNVGSDIQFKTVMVADNRSRRVYHDIVSLGSFQDAKPYEGRMGWDGHDAWIYPAETEVNPRFWATTGYYFSSIPFVLADPGIVYETLPDQELDDVMYDMVKVGYEADVGDASDTYTLYVDKESDQLRAIRYTVTFGGRPAGAETLFYYEDYVTVDGLTVPTRFDGYWVTEGKKGDFKNEAWVTNVSFSVPFDETQLVMPEGARVVGMPGGD